MRHLFTASLLALAVLLTSDVCLAQEKQPSDAGVKADSQDMWTAYKKMWEGKWETTIQTPNGDAVKGESTVEVILDGKAVLSTSTWKLRDDTMNETTIGSWCPKRKSIVVHGVDSSGGLSDEVLTLVNGEQRGSTSFIDADGTEGISKTVITLIDPDTIKVTFVEGRFSGAEFTFKRKKA